MLFRSSDDVKRAAPHGFDLVLLDPPYDVADLASVVEPAVAWLASDGLLVLEHAGRRAAPERLGGLRRVRRVQSGDSALALYAQSPGPAPGFESGDR